MPPRTMPRPFRQRLSRPAAGSSVLRYLVSQLATGRPTRLLLDDLGEDLTHVLLDELLEPAAHRRPVRPAGTPDGRSVIRMHALAPHRTAGASRLAAGSGHMPDRMRRGLHCRVILLNLRIINAELFLCLLPLLLHLHAMAIQNGCRRRACSANAIRRAVRHSSGRCADGFDRAGTITTVQCEQPLAAANAVGRKRRAPQSDTRLGFAALPCTAQAFLRPGRRVCARA